MPAAIQDSSGRAKPPTRSPARGAALPYARPILLDPPPLKWINPLHESPPPLQPGQDRLSAEPVDYVAHIAAIKPENERAAAWATLGAQYKDLSPDARRRHMLTLPALIKDDHLATAISGFVSFKPPLTIPECGHIEQLINTLNGGNLVRTAAAFLDYLPPALMDLPKLANGLQHCANTIDPDCYARLARRFDSFPPHERAEIVTEGLRSLPQRSNGNAALIVAGLSEGIEYLAPAQQIALCQALLEREADHKAVCEPAIDRLFGLTAQHAAIAGVLQAKFIGDTVSLSDIATEIVTPPPAYFSRDASPAANLPAWGW